MRLTKYIILIILGLGFYFYVFNKTDLETREFAIGDKLLQVELVKTEVQKTKGLSGRRLAQNGGMLFVYSEPDYYSIWMPEMNFAIDIIWLDSRCKVVDIKENATPESYPEIFKPKEKASYILEVVAGFVFENNLTIGSQAQGC